MAERIGYTPEDVASEALARYLGAADQGIENPAAWMVSAGRNFVYDLNKKGLNRETAAEPGSRALDQPRSGDQLPVDESLDRRYEHKLYDAAIRQLDVRDRRAIAAFEQEGSMRAVDRKYGIPKSSVQRAFKRLQDVITSESGLGAARRARSRALAYHLGYMSPPQMAMMRARLKWDTALLMEIRALQFGGRRVAALFPAPLATATAGTSSPRVGDRAAALGDRVRDGVHWVFSRGSGHESEAAGVATGGAGFATKAIVTVCAAGTAATGVCVQSGVIDLPGAGAQEPPKERVETTPADAVVEQPVPASEEERPIETPVVEEAPKPAAQVEKELGFESSGSSGGGEFGGPASGGSSSGGSAGGGGFGFEK